jgi:hypothetical protein
MREELGHVNRYPDSTSSELVTELSAALAVPPEPGLTDIEPTALVVEAG